MERFLLFLIAGPLVGGIPFSLFLLLFASGDPAWPGIAWAAILFAYPFGLIPAGVAGAAFVAITPLRSPGVPTRRRMIQFMVGAGCGILGCAAAATLSAFFGANPLGSGGALLWIMLVPSILSGGVCALLATQGEVEAGALRNLLRANAFGLQLAVVAAVLVGAAVALIVT